jgi:hypothetical protein
MENQVMQPVDWCPTFALVKMFNDLDCAEFLQDVEESGKFYQGHKLTDDGELVVDTNYRNCQTAHYGPGEEVYEKIATKLHARIAFINAKYGFELFPEKEQLIPVININRYEGCGDSPARIGMHSDFGPYQDADDRKLSMSILLNDPKEYQGGRFRIFDGGVHHPLEGQTRGYGVVFPSFTIHGVEPVMEGVRYTVVIWFRGPRFR